MSEDILAKIVERISQFLVNKFSLIMTVCLIIGILCIVTGIFMMLGKKKKVGESIMLILLGIGLIYLRFAFGAPILGIGGFHSGISH